MIIYCVSQIIPIVTTIILLQEKNIDKLLA